MGFEGYTPRSLDQALQYLHNFGDETTILAGGTDLLVRHHGRLFELSRIMNICELGELKSIKVVEEGIEIGSLVSHGQIEESAIILNHVPFLAEAAATIGSPQIRHRGTIGGNVANSSPAGDLLPPLLALDTEVTIVSLDRGKRVLPLEEFFTGPGRNVLKKDELITGFAFTIPDERSREKFVKLGFRKALAIATVSAAVSLTLEGNVVEECKIALGAVAPTTVRARYTEELLRGKMLSEQFIDQATHQMLQEIAPISDVRGSQQYRLDTAKALVGRAIRTILQKGGRRL